MRAVILDTIGLVLGVAAALWLYEGVLWRAFLALVLSVLFGWLGTKLYEDSVDARLSDD